MEMDVTSKHIIPLRYSCSAITAVTSQIVMHKEFVFLSEIYTEGIEVLIYG